MHVGRRVERRRVSAKGQRRTEADDSTGGRRHAERLLLLEKNSPTLSKYDKGVDWRENLCWSLLVLEPRYLTGYGNS